MSSYDVEVVDENQPPATTTDAGAVAIDLAEITATNAANETAPAASRKEAANAKIPKHLRHRYWNSFEEMRLVELWRQHSDAVTTLKENLPVFRTIAESMRQYGFLMNPQEVRRKINSLKNKYIEERRRLELEPDKNNQHSDWKLYPLVHCLLAPRQKNQILMHQKVVLNQLFSKTTIEELRKELHPSELPDRKPIQQSNTVSTTPMQEPLNTTTTTMPSTTPLSNYQARYQPYFKNLPNQHCELLRRHLFTEQRLAQIRMDNALLAEQREASMRKLKMEERSFKALESYLMKWQNQTETLLQSLDCAAAGGGVGVGE